MDTTKQNEPIMDGLTYLDPMMTSKQAKISDPPDANPRSEVFCWSKPKVEMTIVLKLVSAPLETSMLTMQKNSVQTRGSMSASRNWYHSHLWETPPVSLARTRSTAISLSRSVKIMSLDGSEGNRRSVATPKATVISPRIKKHSRQSGIALWLCRSIPKPMSPPRTCAQPFFESKRGLATEKLPNPLIKKGVMHVHKRTRWRYVC